MHDPDAHARKALRLIGPDPQNWVPDRPDIDHNVVIVGGGQSGSAFAFALRRAGIGKVTVIDMAEDEARAGVWLNAARMNLLRTPKTLPGPEYRIAALSERVLKFSNFRLHLRRPLTLRAGRAGRVVAQTGDGEFHFDFAIAGTGYFVDPGARPELVDFAHHILLWRDRFTPPADEEDEYLAVHPNLGIAHEYLEKVPGTAPYLRDIHIQNPAGFVSFGVPVGDVPSIKRGLPAVTARISRDLFFADFPVHQQRLGGDVASEFPEALYAPAGWEPPAAIVP
jgi:cation diffusion facilitator CzcD-associated flavoprotein CzcO